MKCALLLAATLALALAAPRNQLTCDICVDVITDLGNFITEDTTEAQIVEWFKEICHVMGSLLQSPELEAECNALFEDNIPGIIDGLVNDNLNATEICTSLGACP